MSLAWMFSTIFVSAFFAIAAHLGEAALRAHERQGRAAWIAAIAASVTWPFVAPWIRAAVVTRRAAGAVVTLPALRITPDALVGRTSGLHRIEIALMSLWAIASLILLFRLAMATRTLSRIRSHARAARVDGVPVLMSDAIGPAVVGLLSPAVLFPRALLSLDDDLRALVLRHEEEHCRAHDPIVTYATAVAVAMLPWNLPLWWMARRVRLAVEIDCDARVLSAHPDVSSYARLLLLVSNTHVRGHPATMLAPSPSHLERRIIAMRRSPIPRRALRASLAIGGLFLAITAACATSIEQAPTKQASRMAQLMDAGSPFFEFQVEKQATPIAGTGLLKYPSELRASKRQGVVLGQFIVATNGEVEPGSFKELKSDDPLFTAAVVEALKTMRFEPAQVGGRPVKQLVQQPFTFSQTVQ